MNPVMFTIKVFSILLKAIFVGEAKALLAKAQAKAKAIETVANALGRNVSTDCNQHYYNLSR